MVTPVTSAHDGAARPLGARRRVRRGASVRVGQGVFGAKSAS
jgi:hypothetical protein